MHTNKSIIVVRRGKRVLYILCIAAFKRTLKSSKVKLCNTTQNVPLTSGAVTISTLVVKRSKLHVMNIACICMCGHHLYVCVLVVTILHDFRPHPPH